MHVDLTFSRKTRAKYEITIYNLKSPIQKVKHSRQILENVNVSFEIWNITSQTCFFFVFFK